MENRFIYIKEAISADLALRNKADSLFDRLEKFSNHTIVIDFSGVDSISRSFAHQYLTRRNASKKLIRETNVPKNIKKMFKVIKSASSKRQLLDPDSMPLSTMG